MITLVTGGSKSGKSGFAENRIMDLGDCRRIYIATMCSYDKESEIRIENHRKLRKERQFETIERYTDIGGLSIEAAGSNRKMVLLLECLSNLLANEMYLENGIKTNAPKAIVEGIRTLSNKVQHLVIVTNKVCCDGVSYQEETMKYMEYLGRINQELSALSRYVIEVVYGIPLWIKGDKHEWPL